ncbi:MAG: hypothetical protein LBU67_02995, partial [Oscillospiraceae bacterium]|nr:hypothetical protein [Oscillospiraceae bacterium]
MTDVKSTPWEISRFSQCDDVSESIFCIGNGKVGVRGYSLQEEKKEPQAHSIFRAGLFEYIKPGITDMVQLPDALCLLVAGEQPQAIAQRLNMRNGVLTHQWEGTRVSCTTKRMVSMADQQLICISLELTAKEAGTYAVISVVDGHVRNLPVHDDQMVRATETLQLLAPDALTEHSLHMHTVPSGHALQMEWALTADRACERTSEITGGKAKTCLSIALKQGETLCVQKQVRILVKGEPSTAQPADPWQSNEDAWAALWRDCDIQIDADEGIQGALRYTVFQM